MTSVPDPSQQRPPESDNKTQPPPFAARLHTIRRARNFLMVCFLTFPLYVYAITELLGGGRDITWLMLGYMLLYAVFGINMSVKRCPRCHQQFFVKKYFLNPFRRSCAHCGLDFGHIHGEPL
ncbi:MAG: hypothetical protein KKD00_02650 [Gammaproteobacteria bacterium]|nr:hypothetical protein [Gammaproteobacteria bacterium]